MKPTKKMQDMFDEVMACPFPAPATIEQRNNVSRCISFLESEFPHMSKVEFHNDPWHYGFVITVEAHSGLAEIAMPVKMFIDLEISPDNFASDFMRAKEKSRVFLRHCEALHKEMDLAREVERSIEKESEG